MPCEARRVVVLTEEAYKRLKETKNSLPKMDASIQVDSFDSKDPIFESIPVSQSGDDQKTPSMNEVIPSSFDKLDPLEGIHKRFQKCTLELFNKLNDTPQFTWNQVTGQVYIDGHPQGIGIKNLLKAVCVPFTNTKIPPACVELIKSTGLKPRNHKLNTPTFPKWHPYFTI